LLKFSIQYPDFFLPYKEETYNNLERISISLRKMHARLNDDFYNKDYNDIEQTGQQLDKLFEKFIMSTSEYSEIFKFITTPDIKSEFDILNRFWKQII
jgi:hypothetical protein